MVSETISAIGTTTKDFEKKLENLEGQKREKPIVGKEEEEKNKKKKRNWFRKLIDILKGRKKTKETKEE